MLEPVPLIPAQAGIQAACCAVPFWVPAFAGTSGSWSDMNGFRTSSRPDKEKNTDAH
jgi:hypothetical protein